MTVITRSATLRKTRYGYKQMEYIVWFIILEWMQENDPYPIEKYINFGNELFWAAPVVYQFAYQNCNPTRAGATPPTTECYSKRWY